MTRSLYCVAAVALSVLSAQSSAFAQQKDFSWEGKIQPGRWLYVRNLNGGVRVEKGTGDKAEVVGVKRWRRGDPDEVRIEMKKIGSGDGDVIICAFWNDRATCDEEGYHSRSDGWLVAL